MIKTLEIAEGVTSALKAMFDNQVEQAKISSSDIVRRETILHIIQKMQSPTDYETNMLDTLSTQISTAKTQSEALKVAVPGLIETFQHEFSKWLSGKYLYNRKQNMYIHVLEAGLCSDDNDRNIAYIKGPQVRSVKTVNKDGHEITAFAHGNGEYKFVALRYLSWQDYQSEFELLMRRFEECELSDITDAIDAKKKEWDDYYDAMKTEVETSANNQMQGNDNGNA